MSGQFMLRLALAYLVVPWSGPALSLLVMHGGAGVMPIYALFSFAAMVLPGLPLLYLYARLGWTGFVPFIAGGALCAAATYALVMRGTPSDPAMFVFFTLFGVVEGAALRLILYGAKL
jgi:hypothetical protein